MQLKDTLRLQTYIPSPFSKFYLRQAKKNAWIDIRKTSSITGLHTKEIQCKIFIHFRHPVLGIR